jgi:hypothetical protein
MLGHRSGPHDEDFSRRPGFMDKIAAVAQPASREAFPVESRATVRERLVRVREGTWSTL